MSTLEKIEKAVVEGYQKIEDGVVGGYKKIEEGAIEGFKKVDNGRIEKISDAVTGAYQKVEAAVTGTFGKVADGFVEKVLAKEGENVEEAKERITKEQAEIQKKNRNYANVEIPSVNTPNVEVKPYDVEAAMKSQKEMVKKSIEAAKNVGKR